jgi:predicted  nucleic acid-binding Zn-ribbon protein
VDAGNALLATLVTNLEKRTQTAEHESKNLMEENSELRQRLAKSEERIDTLQTQVQVLTDRLIQRGQR